VEIAAAADTTVVLEAPEMGDEVQAIKAGLLEVADLVVVNKGDKPGAQRTAAQLRAMLVASAGPKVGAGMPDGDGTTTNVPDRPRPKRPDVLVTTAATGEGVPELLAALDRHRETGRSGRSTAARLARAEAQVWAIVGDRVRERLARTLASEADATATTLRAVAAYELDPYAAADRLLDRLVRDG
jgi:LAO/AO transport system kinase